MFERFTEKARRVVVYAQEEARMLNQNYIGTEHLLLGLIRELSALRRTEGTPPRFLQAALRELARHEGTPEPIADMAKRLHLSRWIVPAGMILPGLD